jgi:hypothetical protein
MASAEREAIRTRARMESQNVRDQHLEAGDRTVSPVFRRLHRKVAHGPGGWLAGFKSALQGDPYIYAADVRDRLTWTAGFIEGADQRLARIRITPRFVLPLWWQP